MKCKNCNNEIEKIKFVETFRYTGFLLPNGETETNNAIRLGEYLCGNCGLFITSDKDRAEDIVSGIEDNLQQ